MGAWGNNSEDCDSVMDSMDKVREYHRILTMAETSKILSKVKPNKDYDMTELVGCVVWLLKRKHPVDAKYIKKALADAEAALANEEYLGTWKNVGERRKALETEINLLVEAGKGIVVKKKKTLINGAEFDFKFKVDLDDLVGCGGIEGVNDLLDEAMADKHGHGVCLTDISYKVVGHKEDSVTLLASGILEIQD